MIDEPEAFLHPSQARKIAYTIARTNASRQRQAIISTHSAEVLMGAIEAAENVIVCRG